MATPLRLLLVEDSEQDAELLLRHLRKGGLEVLAHRVETGETMLAALSSEQWDLIISDYTMPCFSGLDALKLAREHGEDIPFIIVSGNIGEEKAVATMLAGAHDYVMKDNLARLMPAIERELKDAALRRERHQLRDLIEMFGQATYGVTGEAFFCALSECLGQVLGVRYVHIGEFVGLDSEYVHTLSSWYDGVFLDNFTYPLVDKPCERTVKGEVVLLDDVAGQYPEFSLPADMPIQGYMGFPLRNTLGKVIGLIVAVDDKAFAKIGLLEYVLQYSATRAAAEIERVSVETQLRNSEEYLRGILDNIQDTIYRVGGDGMLDYVSPSVYQLMGYRPEEVIGKRLSDFYVEEDGREKFLKALDACHGNIFNYETPLRRKDGSTVWVSINAHYYYDPVSGAVAGVEGISRNITARKLTEQALHESEELFSKAFHGSPAMISISRLTEDFAKGEFVDVNESFITMTGYSREELIGHSAVEIGLFIYTEQRENIINGLRSKGRITDLEIPFHTKNEEVRYALGSIELLEINTEPCVLLVCQDITERKQANEKLVRYREQLEDKVAERTRELTEVVSRLESEITERCRIEAALVSASQVAEAANLAKTKFLANMSHELRTPLNSIIGFTELLMIEPEEVINSESREKLGYVLDSAWHLLQLINDILDLSKIEAGKMLIQPTSFDVQSLLDATLVMFQGQASESGISLLTQIDSSLKSIVADERKLKQVLSNLLANAIKFSTENSQITIRAERVGMDEFVSNCGASEMPAPYMSVFIRFSVSDSGIGIAAEDIDKLFKPFVQVDASLTRRYEGSGLGLHLCRQIVDLHGGCIWVESELGQGSTFSFILPCGPRD
ncbi:PAS domain S-box protein [Sulfuriflexus mobilis]|uniref:PAS domain S-box protein n=1 Tax=Sulfuriflexus mobilis TaxID=1811807 RepID=UPI000F82A43E|nr:PAS domain S-box protein [Sulfuriflexus mobilis]